MLPRDLHNQLIGALLKVPNTETRTQRTALLSNLGEFVHSLSRDESAFTDWMLVVPQLDDLGRLSTGERPLIILAQTAMLPIEGTDAGRKLQAVSKALEDYYDRGEPPPPAAITDAHPPAVVQKPVPEAIIFGDERVEYAFVQRAFAVAGSVARLAVPYKVHGQWAPKPVLGTGWLIAPGLLMTNHHVLFPKSEDGAEWIVDFGQNGAPPLAWFDYRVEGGKRDERRTTPLHASAALDYAVLRVEGALGRKALRLARPQPILSPGDRLNIVQHPRGGPVKYAMRSNHYIGTAGPGNEHCLRYLTDTEGGSSGSPVFDDTWRVVALHHAWKEVGKQVHQGQVTYVNNEGIAIETILADLPDSIREEVESAQAELAKD